VTLVAGGADIEYRTQGCRISFPAEAAAEAVLLLGLLRTGGKTRSQIAGECPGFAPRLPQIIADFDHLGLLCESDPAVKGVVYSGAQVYRELARFAERVKLQASRSAFLHAMDEGTITRSQLVGYALEYWQLVHRAPALLAPALGNVETRSTRDLLLDFYVSELHHERMLEAALSAAEFDVARLSTWQPLPMTFALCATLGALARQYPLAFKSVLFLFEQPYPEFNASLLVACTRLGLPDGFSGPIVQHSRLNEGGHHDDISRALLEEVPVIGDVELRELKKHVAVVVEQMVLQEDAILRYYASPGSLQSRFFD
jgi:hypothetical protein